MKRTITLLYTLLATTAIAYCQLPYLTTVEEILRNSPMAQNLELQKSADSLMPYSQTIIENPEVEFGYYAGSPSDIGARWDLSVTQTLPLPYSYKAEKQHRKSESQLAVAETAVQQRQLQQSVANEVASSAYLNSQIAIEREYLETQNQLVALYKQEYAEGECSKIDLNRVVLEQITAQNKLLQSSNMLKLCAARINALVGYQVDVQLPSQQATMASYGLQNCHADTLLHHSAAQQLRSAAQQHAEAQVAEARAEWLPEVSVGYASENTTGETFRGGVVSISLPLWNNMGNLRTKRLHCQATTQRAQLQAETQRGEIAALRTQCADLQNMIEQLRHNLQECNSSELLQQALLAGEISLDAYLRQVEEYYDARYELTELQHQLDEAMIKLYTM